MEKIMREWWKRKGEDHEEIVKEKGHKEHCEDLKKKKKKKKKERKKINKGGNVFKDFK